VFQKYVILAVVQAVLFAYAMPIVVGLLAGLFGKERALRRPWAIALAMLAIVETIVMIEKHGVPLVTGHIYNMFSPDDLTLNQQVMFGLFGDAILLLLFRYGVGKGLRAGLRMATRPPRT
jgi:hypothetical protein